MRDGLQEKTKAAAAPRKPKNGAVSSPLNEEEDMIGFRRLVIGSQLLRGVCVCVLFI